MCTRRCVSVPIFAFAEYAMSHRSCTPNVWLPTDSVLIPLCTIGVIHQARLSSADVLLLPLLDDRGLDPRREPLTPRTCRQRDAKRSVLLICSTTPPLVYPANRAVCSLRLHEELMFHAGILSTRERSNSMDVLRDMEWLWINLRLGRKADDKEDQPRGP